MWKEIFDLFKAYMGTGLVVIFYLFSLMYLYIREKRSEIRICFLYVPLICLILFFMPPFRYMLFLFLDNEVYYRILWLLPMTVTIAYACVHLCCNLNSLPKMTIVSIIIGVIFALTGSYIYRNVNFKKAENIYHVPDCVVDICDDIKYEGREVMAVFPMELLQYVRQYSPYVCMPYGRESIVESWNTTKAGDLFECMEENEPEAEKLSTLARKYSCVYIILSSDKKTIGDMKDYNFEVYDEVDNYVIYKDITVDLSY